MTLTEEWQFDGLVGPTHHYAGLAQGNIASERYKHTIAHPKQAALQGIKKMQLVRELGHKQAFFLPKFSHITAELHRLGFTGKPAMQLEQAYTYAPQVLASLYSSASMWAANMATIAPSADTGDGKVHIVPANLVSHYHRALEAPFSTRQLKRIFHDARFFSVHDPLPAAAQFADEGAANHMRLCTQFGDEGVHVFVYGIGHEEGAPRTTRFPARQHEEASRALARLLDLPPARTIFVQQSPQMIDAGVFHHDVIGMSSQLFMVQHEAAFVDKPQFLSTLQALLPDMYCDWIAEDFLPAKSAVASYFYNSQLLTDAAGNMTVLAPMESQHTPEAHAQFHYLLSGRNPIADVRYVDLRQSMKNGGGPACLRLRVVLNEQEAAAMHQGIIASDATLRALTDWVERYYRETLCLDDLRDPHLLQEVEEALYALCEMTAMKNLYDFQSR